MSMINDFSWMIGGPQGSGVDSSATLFARALTVAGHWVFGKREYHSNIKGKHSYFQVRVNNEPVHSHIDEVHLLATFEDSTANIHAHEIVPNGAFIYDVGVTKPEHQELDSSVLLFPLDFAAIINQLAEQTGQPTTKLAIVKNTVAVASSLAVMGVPFAALEEALKGMFTGKKVKVADLNIQAGKLAYDAVMANENIAKFPYKMEPQTKKPAPGTRVLMNGATASGLGKIKAGCRIQTYYSITPAVDECIYLENHPEYGMIVFQAEDELAAVNMTIGAATTGIRASTATSGPGFCLMAEGIGWAGMNEIPVVIYDYQRGGPSTGLPTRNEQGDLLFAVNIGHGDFPKIILAPGDMDECFYDAFEAFNLADRYQTPVIVIPDKALANSTQSINKFDETNMVVDRGQIAAAPEGLDPLADPAAAVAKFARYKVTESGVSPRVLPGTPGRIHWMTGDEHTEEGNITEKPAIRLEMHDKRMRKLELVDREMPESFKYKVYGPEDADITIVSWGSIKGAIQDALKVLNTQDKLKVNFLQIRVMSPFPVEGVTKILNRAKKTIIFEANYTAQLAQLIRMRTGIEIDSKVLKWTGRPVSENEVVNAVREVVKTNNKRVVLTAGH